MSDPQASPPPEDLAQRLHPAAILIWPLGQLRSLVLVLVAGTVTPRMPAVMAAGLLLSSVVRWMRLRYRVSGGALVVESGLVEHRRRVIPAERVQSVDIVRGLRHRAFGVAEVRVETVGGQRRSEGALEAVSLDEAQRLRVALVGARPPGTGAGAGEREDATLAKVTPGRLVVAGLTGGRVGIAAALFGLGDEVLGDRFAQLAGRVMGGVELPIVLGLAVVALLAAFALSVGATIVANWNFMLTRDGDTLRVRRGLLEQRQETVPLRRVQAVRVEENLVRHALGLATVRVEVAGRHGAGDQGPPGTLLPIGPRAQVLALVATVLGDPRLADVTLQPMPVRARSRRMLRALLPVIAATVAAAWRWGPRGLLVAFLAVPAFGLGLASYRALGHARAGGIWVAREGMFVRRTTFVPVGHVQSVALAVSPLQGWRRLATLRLHIARGQGGTDPRLVDLDRTHGRALLAAISSALVVGPGSISARAARHG